MRKSHFSAEVAMSTQRGVALASLEVVISTGVNGVSGQCGGGNDSQGGSVHQSG